MDKELIELIEDVKNYLYNLDHYQKKRIKIIVPEEWIGSFLKLIDIFENKEYT